LVLASALDVEQMATLDGILKYFDFIDQIYGSWNQTLIRTTKEKSTSSRHLFVFIQSTGHPSSDATPHFLDGGGHFSFWFEDQLSNVKSTSMFGVKLAVHKNC